MDYFIWKRGNIQVNIKNPGTVLLSQAGNRSVPSALEGLTTVFGMGTGVAPPVWAPGKNLHSSNNKLIKI